MSSVWWSVLLCNSKAALRYFKISEQQMGFSQQNFAFNKCFFDFLNLHTHHMQFYVYCSCEESKAVPSFRVTCSRTHSVPSKKHVFTSMEAACQFGGGINDFLGWKVDLNNFDIEVLLNIVDNHVVVGISLTKESLYRRNIVHFGPTTLRSTLAYCLAMVAEIKQGTCKM